MVLRELGVTCIKPTVPHPGGCALAISSTFNTNCELAINASLRKCIGVVPACDSRPINVALYQR